MLKSLYFWGALVLLSLLYFVLTSQGDPGITVAWGAVTGVLSALFLHVALTGDDRGSTPAASALLAALAVVAGTVLKALTPAIESMWDIGSVPMAALTARGFELLRGWSRSATCFLCRSPVRADQSFRCPRCGQSVCATPTCWSGRHIRCMSCLQREVVLFPSREDWWYQQVGERVHHGACDSCYKEAHEADLRPCGQCPLLMCRRCWDYHNGRCSRCGWHFADIPPGLRPYMPAAPRATDPNRRTVSSRNSGGRRGGGR